MIEFNKDNENWWYVHLNDLDSMWISIWPNLNKWGIYKSVPHGRIKELYSGTGNPQQMEKESVSLAKEMGYSPRSPRRSGWVK